MVSVVEFLTDQPNDKVLIKGWESDSNPDVLTGNETGHAPYEEGDHLSYIEFITDNSVNLATSKGFILAYQFSKLILELHELKLVQTW